MTDSPSIMLTTESGTLVMSLHFSCQVGIFRARMSLAWKHQRMRACVRRCITAGVMRRLAPCLLSRGSCWFDRRTCSVCLPGNRSAAFLPARPLCSRRRWTSACPSGATRWSANTAEGGHGTRGSCTGLRTAMAIHKLAAYISVRTNCQAPFKMGLFIYLDLFTSCSLLVNASTSELGGSLSF